MNRCGRNVRLNILSYAKKREKKKKKKKRVGKFIIVRRRGGIARFIHAVSTISNSDCARAKRDRLQICGERERKGRESSRQTETVARLQRKSIDFALLDVIDLQALPSVSVRPSVKAINSWCERAIKGTLHARDASVMGV